MILIVLIPTYASVTFTFLLLSRLITFGPMRRALRKCKISRQRKMPIQKKPSAPT